MVLAATHKYEKKVGGIKAKYVDRNNTALDTAKDGKNLPLVLVVSPNYQRIIHVLQEILEKNGKYLDIAGVELYRQAQLRMQRDFKNRVAALIITDLPDDHHAKSTSEFPLWKTTIVEAQQMYSEAFEFDILTETFPSTLTIVTMFRNKRKLSDDEIDQVFVEFDRFKRDYQMNLSFCNNDEDLCNIFDKDIMDMAINRHRQQAVVKTYERTRTQKLAKAKRVTRDAHEKLTA